MLIHYEKSTLGVSLSSLGVESFVLLGLLLFWLWHLVLGYLVYNSCLHGYIPSFCAFNKCLLSTRKKRKYNEGFVPILEGVNID